MLLLPFSLPHIRFLFQIGRIDDSFTMTIVNRSASSYFENIKISCRGEKCNSCKEETVVKCSFPGWAASLIILIIILVAMLIGVMLYFFQFQTDKQGNSFFYSFEDIIP